MNARWFATGGLVLALVSAPALAEDMGAPLPERFGWTGFYAGVVAGPGSSVHDTDYQGDFPAESKAGGGGFIGAQVGYDMQFGNVVLGAVADFSGAEIGPVDKDEIAGLVFTTGDVIDYVGTVRVRSGVAFDRFLVYGHGGVAFGRVRQYWNIEERTIETNAQNKVGWTAGVGAEFAALANVSVGAEYGFIDLGHATVLGTKSEVTRLQVGKLFLNYRF